MGNRGIDDYYHGDAANNNNNNNNKSYLPVTDRGFL
jgi:hypothetical protein